MKNRLVFFTEARFLEDDNGAVYGIQGFGIDLWSRYLDVFDELIVVARGRVVSQPSDLIGMLRSDCDRVSFRLIPASSGALPSIRFIKALNAVTDALKRQEDTYFIGRVPGVLGLVSFFRLQNTCAFGLEVVGDPWDVFNAEGFKKLVFLPIRVLYTLALKRAVVKARSVLYVTNSTLQKRYPTNPSGRAEEFIASNIKLPSAGLADKPKSIQKPLTVCQLVCTGSLEKLYKGPEDVLHALALLKRQHSAVVYRLTWLGGGRYLEQMVALSEKLGLTSEAQFLGAVSNDIVKSTLKEADIFVTASHTEGLPRAVIEAMSLGLPCIGTRVGGIPELLAEKALVAPKSPKALAAKLKEFTTDCALYNHMSAINLEKAANYKEEILSEQRRNFYKSVIHQKSSLCT